MRDAQFARLQSRHGAYAAPTPKSNPANSFAAQSVRTVAAMDAPIVRVNSLKNNAGTAADDADANGARRSGAAELPPV
jgi:hypothetical protein